jgi:hypothetical protein
LIVSLLCLALVLVPVALLALIEAVWVLLVALLSLIAAVAILTLGIAAAFADAGELDSKHPQTVPAPDQRQQVTPLGRREAEPLADRHDRKAA